MNKRDMVADLREKRSAGLADMDALLARAKAANRSLNKAESAEFDRLEADIRAIDERSAELEQQITADEAAAPMARAYAPQNGNAMDKTSGKYGQYMSESRTAMPGYSRLEVRHEEIYRPDNGQSYFRDLWMSRKHGDRDAAERLHRNQQMQADRFKRENRALSTTNGGAGEFVPPLWLENEFVRLARPGRVTVDLVRGGRGPDPLPAGTDVLNVPKISTGTSVAVQSTQNSAVSQTDMATTSISSPVTTIAGAQVLSLQLIEQSPLNVDDVVLGDLAAAYGATFDNQVLNGSGSGGNLMGILTLSGTNQVTFTSASPTVALLYSKVADAIQRISTARYLPPDAIIMHPRRWAWLVAASDSSQRPLVVPVANGVYNAVGVSGPVAAEGYVGSMLGLPVFVDSQVPTNQGAGTNQDAIIVARMADLVAWESHVRAEAFEQTYASNLSVLVRLYNYVSFQPARYPQSISVISGTGLVAPTF